MHAAAGPPLQTAMTERCAQEQAEAPLVAAGLLPADFVDSWALNVYHDGSEGIQSHYDDAGRFMRPITSLRLFSDCRLSFGTQLYGSASIRDGGVLLLYAAPVLPLQDAGSTLATA